MKIRLMQDGDRPLIVDSWLLNFKGSSWSGSIPNNLYYSTYRAVINQLLDTPAVKTYIAVDPDADNPKHEIYGYLVAESGFSKPCIHFAYTKDLYKRAGVFTALCKAAGISLDEPFYYTFPNKLTRDLQAKKYAPGEMCQDAVRREKKEFLKLERARRDRES